MNKKKFLCVCEGGNVRSVSLAFYLKHEHDQDALACGWRMNSPATRRMLYEWADYIVLLQEEFRSHVPDEFADKIRVVDVGRDIWFNPFHPDLKYFMKSVADDWSKKDFVI